MPAGTGVGWRPEIAGWVAGARPAFCEVIAENLAPAVPSRGVAELRERGVPVVPHGVRLSLGGAEPVEPARVAHLAACADALGSPLVSEHIAFTRAGGLDAGHLLPVPRTREALDALTANVRRTQAELPVPLALEPIAALFDWPDDEYTEPDFLRALLDRTGALLLLDVANVRANAVNRGQDAAAALDRMPLDRVAYVHVAGGAEHPGDPGLYHDTHTDPVPDGVLHLLARLAERLPGMAVMLERDGRYPPATELDAELSAIAAAAGVAR
ncbi:endonuclease [Pseudonocardia sp. CNS-139]|nr:endonuclease [Pseudonocardia sp. CNS-139]